MEKDEELLNNLREEYTLINSKKALLRDHGDIVKEIFITIKNRIDLDPIITKKFQMKKSRQEGGNCCNII